MKAFEYDSNNCTEKEVVSEEEGNPKSIKLASISFDDLHFLATVHALVSELKVKRLLPVIIINSTLESSEKPRSSATRPCTHSLLIDCWAIPVKAPLKSNTKPMPKYKTFYFTVEHD